MYYREGKEQEASYPVHEITCVTQTGPHTHTYGCLLTYMFICMQSTSEETHTHTAGELNGRGFSDGKGTSTAPFATI